MVFLINAIPALIILLGAFVAYSVKGWKKKVAVVLLTLGISLIYTQIQPSYMPKGTVRSNPVVEFKQLDIPMVDRSLKPKSDADRDELRNKEISDINNKMKSEVEKSKERLKELENMKKESK